MKKLAVLALLALALSCDGHAKFVRCPTCPCPEPCKVECPEGEKPDADCKCVKEDS